MTSSLLMQISLSRKTLLPVTVIKIPVDKVLSDIRVCMKDYLLHENTEPKWITTSHLLHVFQKSYNFYLISNSIHPLFTNSYIYWSVYSNVLRLEIFHPRGSGQAHKTQATTNLQVQKENHETS